MDAQTKKLKSYFEDLNRALEIKGRAEDESHKYYQMYERLLLQSQMTMQIVKDKKPSNEGNNENADQMQQLQAMLSSTREKPKLASIVSTSELESQFFKQKDEKVSIVQKKESSGLLNYVLPKPKRTIRAPKKPSLYHCYSEEDIRFLLDKGMQTCAEEDIMRQEENDLNPLMITEQLSEIAIPLIVCGKPPSMNKKSGMLEKKDSVQGNMRNTDLIIEELKKRVSSLEAELAKTKDSFEELLEENEKLNFDADDDDGGQFEENKQRRGSKASRTPDGDQMDFIKELKELDFTELAKTDASLMEYKPSSRQASHMKARPKKQIVQKSEAANLVLSFLKTFAQNKGNIFKFRMPNRNMLKIISALYTSVYAVNKEMKLSKLFQLKKPIKDLLYQFLLNKFGSPDLASKKMKQFINSLVCNNKVPRVHLFMGFLGLARDLEEVDANFYINTTGYMYNMKMGISCKNHEINECHFIPYARACEVSKYLFVESSKELLAEYYSKLEKIKVPDPSKSNPFIIDVDKFMIIALDQYHILLGKVRDYIDDMFRASDLDGSKTLEFFELDILFKLIEPTKYSFEKCKDLFNHSSELVTENGVTTPIISFNQFINICEAEHLFSEESQNIFLRFNKAEDYVKLIRNFKANYDTMVDAISQKLQSLLGASSYLTKVMAKLKECSTHDNARDAKSSWMMYRFVEDMSGLLYIDDLSQNIMGVYNEMIICDEPPTTKQLLIWKESGYADFLGKKGTKYI